VYEHDSWTVALKKTFRNVRSCSSWSHSLVEHNKGNPLGELRKVSLIACLYGMTHCNILYVKFQRVSMSQSTLNLLKNYKELIIKKGI
jgi:hypothetical protein